MNYESLLDQAIGKSTVEFACSEIRKEDTLKVPCLGYLSETVLVGAIATGSKQVRLNISRCKGCSLSSGLRAAVRSLRQANRILALFGISGMVAASAEATGDGFEPTERGLYSRKEFFAYFQQQTRGRLAETITDVDRDLETADKKKVRLEPVLPRKRSRLLEYIEKLGQPVVDRTKTEGLPFAQVEIGQNCHGCGICATFCPTGALRSYQLGNEQVIEFRLHHCLACGLCADICPESAVTYATEMNTSSLLANAGEILVRRGKTVCSQCGRSYVAEPERILCPTCHKKRKIEEWLIGMWQPR